MALPAGGRVRRHLGGRRATAAYHRMASLVMVAYSGEPEVGEFEWFRRAVVEAAGNRRAGLDVLVEIHDWLERGVDPGDVKSKLEERLVQQGVQIVWDLPADRRSDARFKLHGQGDPVSVESPGYVFEVDGREIVIKQGYVECEQVDLDSGSEITGEDPVAGNGPDKDGPVGEVSGEDPGGLDGSAERRAVDDRPAGGVVGDEPEDGPVGDERDEGTGEEESS